MSVGKRKILIVGLRRSGTTILWETFRRDRRNLCFDEPFHPSLWAGALENAKGTWLEMADLWRNHGGCPIPGADPIFPLEELGFSASTQQREYMAFLFRQDSAVAIDVVRPWNRLSNLLGEMPPILVIHLVRSPVSWVTSHLIPSGAESWRRKLSNKYRRRCFFSRSGYFNNWHYQEIIAEALRIQHPVFSFVRLTAGEIREQPAYIKLLAFWWGVVNTVEQQLYHRTDNNSIISTLEEFSQRPDLVIRAAYERANWSYPDMEYDHIRAVRPGWQEESPKWRCAFERLGIPTELVSCSEFTGTGLRSVLPKANVVP